MNITCATLAETEQFMRSKVGDFQRPCVVLLSGEMGAGKTQTLRWWLKDLGVNDAASPTFAIHHEYRIANATIDHVDLYRVESDADLEGSGFWDLMRKEDGLLFVEWANRLPEDVWPQSWRKIFVTLTKGPTPESRTIQYRIT